jgi:hypothetical protein
MKNNNSGRIGERIVANELEQRGCRVINLNSDGNAANADLLAAKSGGKSWQIQVKTTQLEPNEPWKVVYSYTRPEHISGQSRTLFNPHPDGFYRAYVIVLVAYKSLTEYHCVILPVAKAEEAFQQQLDVYWTKPVKKTGKPKKPSRAWAYLDRNKKTHPLCDPEMEILLRHQDDWNIFN